ncbi:MAG TPA: hypothetical protein PLL77_14540 [Pyrinomonadaceae bacterium]|nr:hypothetical protein [Pyrinomonadaceae bacterium]
MSEIDINTVTPTVGYFYNATKFGITVDSGKTWKIIDVYETMKKDGSDKIARRFERVPRVIVNENGTGSIYAQSYHNKDGEKQEIYTTTDFGQNWQLITSAR